MLYPLSYGRLFSSAPPTGTRSPRYHQPAGTGRHAVARERTQSYHPSPSANPRPSAEAEGFEPSVPLRAQHISSVSHSAALARFLGPPWGCLLYTSPSPRDGLL